MDDEDDEDVEEDVRSRLSLSRSSALVSLCRG